MSSVKTVFVADARQYNVAIKDIRKQTIITAKTIQQKFQSVNTVFNMTANSIALLAGGGGMLWLSKSIVQLGADMEQTRVAFATFLGDVKKADRVISDLMKFSVATPFEPDEVIKTGKSLLAMGVSTEKLIPVLKRLGDVSAGTGKPLNELAHIYGKVMAKGKMQAEELNQLAEAGIPIISKLSEMYGVSGEEIYKMASQGKISFQDLDDAFSSMTAKGGKYFNLMEKQSKTFGGLWSTFVGQVKAGGQEIGEAVLPALKDILADLISEMNSLAKSGALKAWGETARDVLKTAAEWIKIIINYISEHKEGLKTLFFSYAAIKIIKALSFNINGLSNSYKSLVSMINLLETTRSGQSLSGILNPTHIKLLTVNTKVLFRALGTVRASLLSISAVAATAFVGWNIGKTISELTGLNKKIEQIVLNMQGFKKTTQKEEALRYYIQNIQGTKRDPGSFERYYKKLIQHEQHVNEIRKQIHNEEKKRSEERKKQHEAELKRHQTERKIKIISAGLESPEKLKEKIIKIKDELKKMGEEDTFRKRINAWNKKIEELKGKIEGVREKLAKFGITDLKGPILKTKEQIEQDRKDEILRKKIEIQRRGGKVTFTKEEIERIKQLEEERKKALAAGGNIKEIQTLMSSARSKRERQQYLARWQERKAQLADLQKQYAVSSQVAEQIDILKKGNVDVVKVLEKVKEILNDRLPAPA